MLNNNTINSTNASKDESTKFKKSNYIWIKFHINLLDDPDFMSLSDSAVSVYTKMYLLAGRSDAGGALISRTRQFDMGKLVWYLRTSEEQLTKCIQELIGAGLVNDTENGIEIAHFMVEQGPGDNEQRKKWRENTQRRRLKIKEEEKDKIKEVEERREESHGDVTVTYQAALAPSTNDYAFLFDIGEGKKDYDNGLTRDDPFTKVPIQMWEMIMNTLIGKGRILRKDERIPIGYFKITKQGIAKIKKRFNNDLETINIENLSVAIDYWYWYCLETEESLFNIERVLDIYENGVDIERIKFPEVYKNTIDVEVIRKVTGLEPPVRLYPKIYDTFDGRPENQIEFLSNLYQTWIGRGYKANNYDWFFDWYANDVDVYQNR